MLRLALGGALLAGALSTGFLAGATGDGPVRAVTRYETVERVVERAAEPAAPAEQPASAKRKEGAAPATVQTEDQPEASDIVDRMRRLLPDLAPWQAAEIRKYHRDYKSRLKDAGLSIAAVLEADPESQRRAVERLAKLKRERKDFLRNLLGNEAWERWTEIERTGGRDVEEFLRSWQGR
ncbi:MAG: hypothetical protein OER88_10545 [Planctomycetota bacterium]|nr:hypothetical protein [Planctomycetota bacterium]